MNNNTGGEKDSLNRQKASPDVIYTGVPTIEYDSGRDEKPWQRIPCAALIILVGFFLLLGYFTQLVEDGMPRVINEIDISRDNSETFSEEAAWRYLHIIAGDTPRVSGTRDHLRKTQDLKELVDSVAALGTQRVMTDWQMVTDDYWLAFTIPHVNVYQNASNIIALLEGESGFHSNGTIGTSLLVNCHYDSVPYAIGASDDALFCAVMVETMAKLARRTRKLKHNVVFLFNGAEENPLQGSHGFLHHPWSRGVTNVINLDAAGMNGKPIVFQVTDPRLLRHYQRATFRPSGQSIGEFLFTTGIIPSDTDFRIWRDFGKFHGLDIAFTKWGHVYHTRYDRPDLIQAGVIQNAGNMLLALVDSAADDEALKDQIEPSAAVYFDYLYLFMVTYSYAWSVVADLLVVIFAVLSVGYYVWLVGPRWTTIQELLFSMLGRFVCMLAGIVVSAILIPIMVASTQQLRYLSLPWVVVPLYWLPYVITAVCTSHGYDAWRTKKSGFNRSIRSLQAMSASRLILAAVLLVMTCIPSLTTLRYMISVPLFTMSLMALVSLTVVRYVRLEAWMHLLMEVLFSLPTVMFMMSLALRFSATILPTMGRTPTNNPDYTVALISVGLAILISATVSGIELLFSRNRLWMITAPVAIACVVLMFIPFHPYSDEGPSTQRHYWFHSEIVSYEYGGAVSARRAGVLVTKHDAHTPHSVLGALRARGLALSSRTDFSADCDAYVHCNLPLFRIRFGVHLHESLLLSTGPPAPFTPESSTRLLNTTCVADRCTYNFLMTGPAHNTITIWPRAGINITSWTFASPLAPSLTKHERPVYIIVHSTATYSDVFLPLEFGVTAVVPVSQQSQPVMDLAHHAFKINHPEDYTSEYRNLVDAMPEYFNIASFLSFRRNYVF